MTPWPGSNTPRVLIVCYGNTCRSVMAEALIRQKLGHLCAVMSAGIKPQVAADAEMAIKTLEVFFGIDAKGHVPQSLYDLTLDDYDWVIAVDGRVAKQLPGVAPGKLIIWRIPDPWGEDLLEYRNALLRINHEVSKFSQMVKSRRIL